MHTNGSRLYRRGDVVRARFDPVEGSEQGGIRPALVISPEAINRHSPIILLAPLTTKKTERIYAFECLVEAGDGGLRARSKALLLQLRGVSRSRITGFYGTVSDETLKRMDAALKIAVGLEKI